MALRCVLTWGRRNLGEENHECFIKIVRELTRFEEGGVTSKKEFLKLGGIPIGPIDQPVRPGRRVSEVTDKILELLVRYFPLNAFNVGRLNAIHPPLQHFRIDGFCSKKQGPNAPPVLPQHVPVLF